MSAISSPEFQAKVNSVRRNRRLLRALGGPGVAAAPDEPTAEETMKGLDDLPRIMELGKEIAQTATLSGITRDINLFERVKDKWFNKNGQRTHIQLRTNGWLLDDVNTTFLLANGHWFNHGSVTFGRSLGADGSLFRHSAPDTMSDGCGLIAYQVTEETYATMSGEQQEVALHNEIFRLESSLAEFVVRTQIL